MPKFLLWTAVGLWIYPLASKYVTVFLDRRG